MKHNEMESIKERTEDDYIWDDDLLLSDEGFSTIINNKGYDPDAASKIPFPNDYLLATFSNLAYQDKGYQRPEGWDLLTTAHNKHLLNGYFGVAFWNSKLRQVVIAHRGTKPTNIGAINSDIKLGCHKGKTEQSQSAVTFVHCIRETIKTRIKEDGIRIQLSITGHSLGGWLAQITTFTIKYFKLKNKDFIEDKTYVNNFHCHTVVFDSPGCAMALANLAKKFVSRYDYRKYGNYYSLDITTYLNRPNFINSVNEHVGIIYLTSSDTHTIVDVIKLFDCNENIRKEVVLDYPLGRRTAGKLLVKRCGWFFSSKEKVPTKPFDENERSLNVFSDQELDFVNNWNHATELSSINIDAIKRKYSLPEFKIDHDNNVIRGKNLIAVIASIKNFQPTKDLIFSSLRADVQDELFYEKIKTELLDYQKQLLPLHNYTFNDKFNLKEFLESSNQILHVYSSTESDIILDLSVLHKIFEYYKNERPVKGGHSKNKENKRILNSYKEYHVLSQSTMKQMLESTILLKGRLNLIVVNCCNTDEDDMETISKLLHVNEQVKLVTISLISWLNNETIGKFGIMEATGFANKLKFQDLMKHSQKLMTEIKLMLHKKQFTLNDIIKEVSFFSGEPLFELLLKPLAEEILINSEKSMFLYFLDLHREVKSTEQIISDQQLRYIIKTEDTDEDELPQFLQTVFRGDYQRLPRNTHFETECSNLKDVIYLFAIKNQKLFLTKIYDSKFYIPRYVQHNKYIDNSVFTLKEDSDLYCFSGNEKEFNKKTSRLKEDQKEEFKFMLSRENARNRIFCLQSNGHSFKIEKDKLIWLCSNHRIQSLRKYVYLENDFIHEEELMKEDSLVILSGGAGTGKTSTLGHLYEYHTKQNHWTFALSLRHSAFSELSEKNRLKSGVKFILKSYNTSTSPFIEHLLSYCLLNKTQISVYLLFDGFDEIYEENDRKLFINLINFLKLNSTAKILITTRNFRCEELENGVATFASYFKTSDYKTTIKRFFANFWYTQSRLFKETPDLEQFEEFAEDILENIKNNLGRTLSKFKDIPLYTRMIAEIITPPINHLNPAEENHTTVNNTLELYNKYVQFHYNIYIKRIELNQNAVQQMWLLESISKRLRELSVTKLIDKNLQDDDIEELEELNKVGLIQCKPYNNLEFLHESIPDYFVADTLRLWLESYSETCHKNWNIENFIVSDFLIKSEYKEIRFFLNLQLNNFTISSNRLMKCRRNFKKLGENALITERRESAFFLCVKENLYMLLNYFVFNITDRNDKMKLLSTRTVTSETPLFLALDNLVNEKQDESRKITTTFLNEIYQWPHEDAKTVLLATLFVSSVSDEHMKIFKEYSRNYTDNQNLLEEIDSRHQQISEYLEACKNNDKKRFNSILQDVTNDTLVKHYLLLTTNKLGQTGLHLTTSKKIIKSLLKSGANINLQDTSLTTPLSYAIQEKRTQIAELLIAEGCNTNILDNKDNGPLFHAAKSQTDNIIKLLLCQSLTQSANINQRNIYGVTPLIIATKYGHQQVVQLLLENGAEINTFDRNGMAAMHYLAKKDRAALIPIFKKYGADINILDNKNGLTPLLYGIQKGKWNVVQALLDNGADVNIVRKYISPMALLERKGKHAIIEKIHKMKEQPQNKEKS